MCCVPLEIGEDTREIRRGEDSVKVAIEDNPSVNLQALMRATILKRLDENVAPCGGSEDRQPLHDGRGDEMSGAKFIDAIATAHGGKLREAQLRRQVRSQVQLGNEGRGRRGEKAARSRRPIPNMRSVKTSTMRYCSFLIVIVSVWPGLRANGRSRFCFRPAPF